MISAIILAAGQSRRMRQPKMLLPWGDRTVIEHVVTTFLDASIEDVLIVTGGAHEQVDELVDRHPAENSQHGLCGGQMLSSLQCGLREMTERAQATLIGLGDQPQVQGRSIRSICEAYRDGAPRLIVSSR
jgi:molybdenum cofactor cytidylyltransferase